MLKQECLCNKNINNDQTMKNVIIWAGFFFFFAEYQRIIIFLRTFLALCKWNMPVKLKMSLIQICHRQTF